MRTGAFGCEAGPANSRAIFSGEGADRRATAGEINADNPRIVAADVLLPQCPPHRPKVILRANHLRWRLAAVFATDDELSRRTEALRYGARGDSGVIEGASRNPASDSWILG